MYSRTSDIWQNYHKLLIIIIDIYLLFGLKSGTKCRTKKTYSCTVFYILVGVSKYGDKREY